MTPLNRFSRSLVLLTPIPHAPSGGILLYALTGRVSCLFVMGILQELARPLRSGFFLWSVVTGGVVVRGVCFAFESSVLNFLFLNIGSFTYEH